MLGPHHDDAVCGIQCFFDFEVVARPCNQFPVPPHIPTATFEHGHKRPDAVPVFGRIGDKDVSHRSDDLGQEDAS